MKEFRKARDAGVPLLAISTADAAACIKSCVKSLNGSADTTPVLVWDCVNGVRGYNQVGVESIVAAEIDPMQTLNPTEFLGLLSNKCAELKTKSKKGGAVGAVIFLLMSNRILEAERLEGLGFITGVYLCRDKFKAENTTLVMLAPSITLPAELKQDVVFLDEPLPNEEELSAICASIIADAGLKPELLTDNKEKIVSALRGLSAFAAEQVCALSLTKGGIDLQEMMKLKRAYIGSLPGVEVREDKISFNDIAGYDNVKNLLIKKISGKRPPRLIIWWDEFDRTIAGNASDTSGVTQDQVACLLGWQQDRLNEDRLSAMILVGNPGCGKSAVAAAVKNEAGCECMRWDLGGMKDSLVGSSEKRLRAVLKVADAMCGGHILMIATCNSLNGVPSPIISRFAFGTYYFTLPTKEEGEALWRMKRKKYNLLDDQPNPTDGPLSGREIQQCCFLADDLKISLAEALNYITPYYTTNATEIEALNKQAHKRWLSASAPGFFQMPQPPATTQRKMNVQ